MNKQKQATPEKTNNSWNRISLLERFKTMLSTKANTKQKQSPSTSRRDHYEKYTNRK